MNKVKYGIIGTGFVADLHLNALKQLRGNKVEVKSVAARDDKKLKKFADRFNIPKVYTNWQEMITDEELDVIDICTPTDLHSIMIKEVARAGKHIICEKPLSGFFGKDLEEEKIGESIPREQMFQEIKKEIDEIGDILKKQGVKFMYAENWVYAPPYTKMVNLLKKSGGTIIDMRAEESHSGSHAEYSRKWKNSGGGALLRLGAHPVGGVIYLKYLEGLYKYNEPIRPRSITGEVGHNTKIAGVQKEEKIYIKKDWVDVEDWGMMVINFTDDSRAIVVSSDGVLGGVRNEMTVYTTNSVVNIDMSQSDTLTAFAPAEGLFGDEYITEKIETKAGWSHPSPDEDWMRGYPHEMEDFINCLLEDREPLSGWYLAEETLKAIYAAYLSAEKGERIRIR